MLTQSRTRAEVATALQGQALLASETVSQTIVDEFRAAQLFSENPVILEKVRQGSRIAAADKLDQAAIEDLERQFILNKQIEPNAALNKYLARAAGTQNVAEIIVAEANGLNVAYSSFPSDFVQKDEDWWNQAKEQTIWMGDPSYDEVTFSVGFNLSRAILDPNNGKFLGVTKLFVTALKFEQLNDYLANAGIQGSQQVQLLDTSANYVLVNFSAQGEEIALTPRSLTLNGEDVVKDIAVQLVGAKTAQEQLSNEDLQRQLRSDFPVRNLEISSTRVGRNGEDAEETLIAAFVYQGKRYVLSTVPQLDWVTVASMNISEIRATGQGNLVVLGLLALALGGMAAALTVALSQRLSAPLNELSIKARQVSGGNLDVKAEPQGSIETRTLAETFNDLVFRVKASLREQTLNARRATLAAEITGSKVLSTEELPSLYSRVVEEAREILQTDRMVVYQFNSDWSGAIVAESVEAALPSAYEQQLGDPCIPRETLEKYLSEGMLVEKDVVNAKFHPEHKALLHNLKVKSILGVPVLSQGRLFGLLITHHCKGIHAWQPAEIDFLKQIGLQVGLVIDRVNLLEQTRFLAEEQRQIREGLQRNALQLLMDVDPVSQGDLTVRAKVTEDEIGTVADSYNATISSLRKIVGQVQEAARQVSETTDTNQTSVRSLSDSAAQQAAEILAALERVQDMANSVRLVSTNAEKAEMAVQQAAETVEAGDEAMNRTVQGFMAIRETVAETTKKVKRLGESSQKISNVVNLISGFAAQTNMLALNASIEASRAGEDGKGFAVVAEEVRELARQSAEATTEIEKLVASIQSETNAVVTAMEAGTEQVVAGTQLVDETRQNLNQITAVSRQISELVESIAQATVTQSQASENVTEVMNTVAAIATDNSTAANEVSQSFEQLRAVAQTLESEVARFKVS
ncbi:methyl-accepting chemotaxis protein [Pseudanabaena sp. FACHB-2040]|uniref:methyl-accepting chemotaxis protein n=1 Tax=Pseudanabaena sp. FACHB-2040 TaxID=2692859 RepID=UPI0016894337|nr:GAF domain-containing protein [Pseudanabaena sp. FACHB-2040]